MYGISQNPNTKDYIMVLQNKYCEQCGEEYTPDVDFCKPCKVNSLKKNFTSWTSGNEQIDDFIQKEYLKINYNNHDSCHTMFQWVPFNQFNDIEEIGKAGISTTYSATWNDSYDRSYVAKRNVVLKHLMHNSQNDIDEFLNKVRTIIVFT
jgi:hypothetical protein